MVVVFIGLVLVFCIAVLVSPERETLAQYEQPVFDEDFMKMMHPVELARTYVVDVDLPRQIADFRWKLFSEYQKKGFTKDESFQLVLSGGGLFLASKQSLGCFDPSSFSCMLRREGLSVDRRPGTPQVFLYKNG